MTSFSNFCICRIEIEKQKVIELPLLVQITPNQNEKPQLLIIEIRLPDQPASPYRSHFITHQLNKHNVATPGDYGTTSPIGTSPVNGFAAPFQGSVNTESSASTNTNGPLRPSLIHLSEKPLLPGQAYQALALSLPVNPSGAHTSLSPQPQHISQPQAPSLLNTGSPLSPTTSNPLPSLPSQTAGYGTLTNPVNTIDIRTPSANVGSNAYSPQYNVFGEPTNYNTNAQSSFYPQQNPSFNTGFGSLTSSINTNPATPTFGALAALPPPPPPPPPPPASVLASAPFGSNAQTGFGAFAAIAAPDLTGNRQSPTSNSIFGSPAGALPQPQAPPIPGNNAIPNLLK